MGEIKNDGILTWDMFSSFDDEIREKRKTIILLSRMAISLSVQTELKVSGFEALDNLRERRKEIKVNKDSELPQSKIDNWF